MGKVLDDKMTPYVKALIQCRNAFIMYLFVNSSI